MPKRTKQNQTDSTAETSVDSGTNAPKLQAANLSASNLIVYMALAKTMRDMYQEVAPSLYQTDKYVMNQINERFNRMFTFYKDAFDAPIVAELSNAMAEVMKEFVGDVNNILTENAESKA